MAIVLQRMGGDDLDEVDMAEHLGLILREGRRFSAENDAQRATRRPGSADPA